MNVLSGIMSAMAQKQIYHAQMAQRSHMQKMAYLNWLRNAKRYDAPSSIPKVKRA